MRLLGIGIVVVIVGLALAVLFHKLDRLEEKIEQAHKPRVERLAAAPNPGSGIRAVR